MGLSWRSMIWWVALPSLTACLGTDAGPGVVAAQCGPAWDGHPGAAITHFHADARRQGMFDSIGPTQVEGAEFGQVWRSPALDHAVIDGVDYAPLIYASPLFVPAVDVDSERHFGALDLAFVATSNGWVYAIATHSDEGCGLAAGDIVWREQLVDPMPLETLDQGVPMGVLSTPVIDLDAAPPRMYVAAHDAADGWLAFALDLGRGEVLEGWPVEIDDESLGSVNTNGPARFHAASEMSQRGALQLSLDGEHLYVAFGTYWGTGVGWLASIDTRTPGVASAFSAAPWTEQSSSGGMWGSAGPAVDARGRIWVTTGNSPPGSGPAPGVWGSSLLQLSAELELERAYTPFNYCTLDEANMDLGASQPLLLDPLEKSSTPNTVAFGGKQGVVYLVDTDALPRAGTDRGDCLEDASRDDSLLPPEPQPYFGTRGPLSVFGPYSDTYGQIDHAKMRTKLASWTPASGERFLFASGSSKATESSTDNVAPSIAKIRIVAPAGDSAYLEIDTANPDVVMHNPGSPIVSGDAEDAVVWVLDRNAPRTAGLLDPSTPGPVLYAFDAHDLRLLWRSDPLGRGGKYSSPIVAQGLVLVGTDRLEAFGG